jgi:hypothetical protein
MHYKDLDPKPKVRNWLVALDQFVWSPKGWFTGSPNIVGSVLFGTHFEQNKVWCNRGSTNCLDQNDGQYHRNTVLLREWDLWYFIAPQMSVGAHFMWYDAKNLTTGPGSNQEAIFGRSGRRLGQRHLELALHILSAKTAYVSAKKGSLFGSPFFWRRSNPRITLVRRLQSKVRRLIDRNLPGQFREPDLHLPKPEVINKSNEE